MASSDQPCVRVRPRPLDQIWPGPGRRLDWKQQGRVRSCCEVHVWCITWADTPAGAGMRKRMARPTATACSAGTHLTPCARGHPAGVLLLSLPVLALTAVQPAGACGVRVLVRACMRAHAPTHPP